MQNIAPVLLFTYKRLDTLKQTVLALKDNNLAEYTDLHIFSDAAKNDKDDLIVQNVRKYIKTISGFKSISIYEASTNKGLANSIIYGVNHIFETSEMVIVLEDDLKTTPNFLSFMNQNLDKYKFCNDVFSISGYSFDLGYDPLDFNDIYFLNRGWSWGWATWKDRWEKVDWSVADYHEFSKNTRAQKEFAQGGSDLNAMLQKQMSGTLDSWAIRWFYSQYKMRGLTVYPKLSKVYNDGFDENATHTTGSLKRYIPCMDTEFKTSFFLPDNPTLSSYYQEKFQSKMGIRSRIISKAQTLLKLAFNRK